MPRARAKSGGRKASAKTGSAVKRKSRAKATRAVTRKNTTTRTTPARASSGTFVCPECGKTFTRPASLGAHRNRAHGVAGTTQRRTPTTRARAAASPRNSRNRALNRDGLLAALFPNGVPAKEQVIREVNLWLDQAERLARTA